nr:MAG TPA: hypothetical protein [Caudoviricetes sp.]
MSFRRFRMLILREQYRNMVKTNYQNCQKVHKMKMN